MPYKRKKYHDGNAKFSKQIKTKRRTKDLDEIVEDLKPENAAKLIEQEPDPDLPGSGQFYCINCSRHFINDQALNEHFRSKIHKRRLKALEMEPYSQKEADAAAGLGSYVPPKLRNQVDIG
ncbi:hypothetical protein CHUAL_000400 [Chamberlinius hualienensis]